MNLSLVYNAIYFVLCKYTYSELCRWENSFLHCTKDHKYIQCLECSYSKFIAQKMNFSIKDFFSKCDQIRSFLRIWSPLRKKSLMENFIFLCSVLLNWLIVGKTISLKITSQKYYQVTASNETIINKKSCLDSMLFLDWIYKWKVKGFLGFWYTCSSHRNQSVNL